MEVRNPEALWLFLLVPAAIGFLIAGYRRGREGLMRLAGAWRFDALFNVFLVKTFFHGLLFVLFLAASVLALADLRWGEMLVEDDRSGYEVILALDVSRSMLAQDIRPSRLRRAAEAMRSFLAQGEGIRYGVVLIEEEAVCVLPVTEDPYAAEALLDHLSPSLTGSSGTNLERGIRVALQSFETAGRFRLVLLATDGESRSGDAPAAAKLAGRRGIPVVPVAVGTESGATVALDDGTPLRDGSGGVVVSKLNRTALEEIARLSGGRVYGVDDLPRLDGELLSLLKGLDEGARHTGLKLEKRPRYRLFLSLALFSLMLSVLIRAVRWKDAL